MILTNAARIIVPRAPIADIIPVFNPDFTYIYSHFRLAKGYTGFCRQVRRSSDNAVLDVGFTSGGLYDIKKELAWAAGSNTTVTRLYDQVAGSLAPYFETGGGVVTASTSGSPTLFRGHPAMLVASGAWMGTFGQSVSAEEFFSVTLIGSMSGSGGALMALGGERSGLTVVNGGRAYDSGPFDWSEKADGGIRPWYWAGAIPGSSAPFMYSTQYDMAEFSVSAYVNGTLVSPAPFIDSEEGDPMPISSGIGTMYLYGGVGGSLIHTFASGDPSVMTTLLAGGNAKNWIY